jgi:hypothetical protein
MNCPNSTASGCRCPEHHPGLLEYSSQPDQLLAALLPLAEKQSNRVTLRVLTTDPSPANLVRIDEMIACDGSMTCICQQCADERAARVRRGVRESDGLPIKIRKAA